MFKKVIIIMMMMMIINNDNSYKVLFSNQSETSYHKNHINIHFKQTEP